MADKLTANVRRCVIGLFSCTGIFAAMQLLFSGVLVMDWPIWYQEPLELIRRYLMVPWGFALGMLCMYERSRADAKTHARYILLALLLLWIIVPFGVRFGFTFNNVTSWSNAFIAFMGVYVMTNWQEHEKRERSLDAANLSLLVVSMIWGGLLLLCAATAQAIELGANGYVFGVEIRERGCLTSGMHYNNTGMLAVCLFFVNLCGMARSRMKPMKAAYGLAAVMMAVVTVLTQSRTARYSLLIASAVMSFGWLFSLLREKRMPVRCMAAAGLAACILAGGYVLADVLANAAVQTYTEQGVAARALAEEEQSDVKAASGDEFAVRSAGDASFSGRMKIWENTLQYWKNNPKYFLIGCGVGGISSLVVEGTIHEEQGSVMLHNTYLQITADYGLIGALLYAGFMLLMVKPVVGAVFAQKGTAGHRALAALVVACLFTGFMESAPLAPLSAMNLMMLFALGHLSGGIDRP